MSGPMPWSPGAWSRRQQSEATVSYGTSATRDASIYAIGMASMLPLGLISVAVTTRVLNVDDYGRLATLFAAASVLTLIAGLGVIHGTLMFVYRMGDDGADGADGFDMSADMGGGVEGLLAPEEGPSKRERQRMLGSGLVLVVIMATLVALPVALSASPVARLLLGSDRWADAVRWMAASMWAGAVWRMVHQIWRMERRPVIWAWFATLRPVLVVALTVVFLASGYGINGPLMATTFGTLAAIVVSLTSTRRLWVVHPRPSDVITIAKASQALAFVQIAGIIQTNVSTLLLAAVAAPKTVAVYTVAARIAAIPQFFGSGFLMSWPVLEMSPVGIASYQRRGRDGHSAGVFTLLFMAVLTVVVVVSIGAGALVLIAGPGYAGAAHLVPIAAAAIAADVAYTGVFRAARFEHRMLWYGALRFVWIAPYIGAAILLVPAGPGWGVAAAGAIASTLVTIILVQKDRYGGAPTPFPWPKIGLATLAAVLAIVVANLAADRVQGPLRLLAELAALAAFPVLLVALRAVPMAELRMAASVIVSAVPWLAGSRRLRRRVRELPLDEREVVALVALGGRSPEALAAEWNVAPELISARLVRGLRRCGGSARGTHLDPEIGRYLMACDTTLERDDVVAALVRSGADPLELHELEQTMRGFRRSRYRGRRWAVALLSP